MQWWFAGNHSDVGGSNAETESRLSDIALQWMIEQAIVIPNGLKIGPVVIHGDKMPGTGDLGEPLWLFPAADGVQHCEIAAMRDTLDSLAERIPPLRRFVAGRNWEEKVRHIEHDAPVHPTVKERFRIDLVVQCAGWGPYRPKALERHDEFRNYYPPPAHAPEPLNRP